MSGFHGLFSLGGIAGAGGMAALLAAGASPLIATLVITACVLVALAMAAPHLLTYGSRREGPSSPGRTACAVPRHPLFHRIHGRERRARLERVFLVSARGMAASYAGLGYTVFALTMTLGRLTGDRIVRLVGGRNVILFGGLCAAAGFALSMMFGSWEVTLLGYALVGVGSANIVPVLFTAVGRQRVMAEHVAVPAITTLGYAGILGRAGRHRLRCAHDQPVDGVPDPGAAVARRRGERADAAALASVSKRCGSPTL